MKPMTTETTPLTLICCECWTELEESAAYEYGGPLSFACEKCVREHYKSLPSAIDGELRTRRNSAVASIKRNRKELETRAAERRQRNNS